MNGLALLQQYNRACALARAGYGVVLLPGVFDGDRATITWAWKIEPRNVEHATSRYDGVRAGYLIDAAINARAHLSKEFGLVFA